MDRLHVLAAGYQPAPVHLQLILSDLCNQDCHFCAYRMSAGLSNELFADGELAKVGHNNPNRMIPTTKALEIVEDAAAIGVKAIQFTGGGEPTVHPDHVRVFGTAQGLGMSTALVTNGVRMDPTAPEMLAHAWIRVSVDAGTAEDYAAVRRVPEGHWRKMWANVDALAKDYCGVLGVGFIVTPMNYLGIGSAAARAKEAGAGNIRVGAVFSSDGVGYYGEEFARIADVIAEAKAAYDGDGFEVVDLFGRRIGDLEEGRPEDPFCGYQYLTMYVGGDLNVYRCCNTAYTRAGTVGSLKDGRLRDLWRTFAYAPFDARTCRQCQFLGQNRAIRGLTTRPSHVEFV